MTLQEMLKEIYAGFVAKAKKDIAAGEKGQKAVDIGNDVITVGKTWTEAIGDDGKISDAEEEKMNETFAAVVDKRLPDKAIASEVVVSFVYNGFTIFGLGFKGLKFYLNKWFGLDLK